MGQSLSAATVHEAAGRSGALPARLKPAFVGATVAGNAFPVLCPVGDNLWLHRAVYEAESGDVLVVATTGTDPYGYWGEILSVAADERGLGGLVIDGGVRDVEALQAVGFPVFAATICLRGTGKDPERGGGFASSVVLDGVPVYRNDLVIGDADGVVVIAQTERASVLSAAEARAHDEARVLKDLREGASTLDIYQLPRT